tara:strand:- start:48 stop:491 length:444 start_codon:yes stop_codon:yes gene_type:complete
MIITFLIIIFVILLVIFFISLKESLTVLDKNFKLLRKFISENSGFFTLLFVFIFFVEQITLIFLIYYFFNVSSSFQVLISVFALIVVTTATLQKFILEKKYEYLSREVNKVVYDNQNYLKITKKLYDVSKELEKENTTLKNKLKKQS